MATLIGMVLAASLLGSLHCAGMCGAFAAFAAAPGPRRGSTEAGRRSLWQLLAYNGGRLAVCVVLGGAAGLLGAALDLGGSMVGLQRAAAVAAGLIMVTFGVVSALRILGVKLPGTSPSSHLARWLRKGHQAAMRWPPVLRALAIGLLTAFLPCGWLYAFVLAAAGTGDPFLGALTMTAFWVGTLPVLVAIGVGMQRLAGLSGLKVQLAASVVVIVLGLVSIGGRWDLQLRRPEALAKPPATVKQAIERVESLRHEKPPCCQKKP